MSVAEKRRDYDANQDSRRAEIQLAEKRQKKTVGPWGEPVWFMRLSGERGCLRCRKIQIVGLLPPGNDFARPYDV